ncbi:transmembrane protein 232 isoform X2 [Hyperolius riggenbachi]|uniref:transmembrane protein 232 isoform X2 n=1 Tax=Hyperolius riggenbachi TaxID=752182 RepID=UPI0035A3A255
MPILKIPVVQKFGIISTKYHQELQRRLLQKNEARHGEKVYTHRRPLEVTEEFIKQFNAAEELEDQEHMLDSARKILHGCKRRSGLYSKGCEGHVNLPLAWTELILLAQCKGRIQEDALDLLILSVDQAKLSQDHIPLLFFIAESVLYRICCDAVQKPYLFSSELKLSKLGLVTFLRLYAFHLLGQLQEFKEQKDRLNIYLKALPACEASYQPYPNVLLSVRVMLKAGEAMCDIDTNTLLQKQPASTDQFRLHAGEAEISPFLWHCLLIWQHTENNSTDLHDIIRHLSLLKEHLHQENWLDSILALFILSQAAKKEISCLRAILDLGCDLLDSFSEKETSDNTRPWEVIAVYSMVLADICLHGSTSDIQKYSFIGLSSESSDASLNSLLHFKSPDVSDSKDLLVWIIPYCAVYNLVKICHDLERDESRDGLRNAIQNALYTHKCIQGDTRVLDAEKIAEAEVNGPTNPFINTSSKSPAAHESLAFFQHLGSRLASALAEQFLPPVVPYVPTPRKATHNRALKKVSHVTKHSMQKKASRPSLRQELMLDKEGAPPPLDIITRTSKNLRKVIEDQWEKELKIRLELEEEELEKEQQEKTKQEEEHFRDIMKKREEKLKKTSKPYELPEHIQHK